MDKLTKPVWLIILGIAALLCFFFGVRTLDIFFPTIAAVAAGVYLVDVRPKLLEVRKSLLTTARSAGAALAAVLRDPHLDSRRIGGHVHPAALHRPRDLGHLRRTANSAGVPDRGRT